MLFHLRPYIPHVGKVLAETAVIIAVLPAIGLALEVVVTRGAVMIAGGLAAVLDHFLYPPFFGLCGGIYRLVTMAARVVDACGDVIPLGLQHIGQVELERSLVAAHDEEVGIALRVDADKSANAVSVFIIEVETEFSLDLVVNARLLHLEARCVDEDIEFVLLALEYRPFLGDLRDAFALGVDQVNIGSVEGGEVLVMEARAFAHEHVPGFERLGRRLVLDNLINTLMNPHHVIDVGVFLAADLLLS